VDTLKRTDIFHKSDPLSIKWKGKSGLLVRGDAKKFLCSLNSEIADIVFLDPPFNLGKNYGVNSKLEDADAATYKAYIRQLISEAVRVLRPGGAFFLYHLPYWASQFAHDLHNSLSFRHWIAVSMKNGFVRGKHLYPAHYALLYYTKGAPARFRRPRFPAKKCRNCGGLVKDYGGYTHIIQKKGINLSDIWEDVSPVRHKKTKLRQANQLPITITDRIVAIAGRKGRVLVDPFVGTGTCLVSATKAKMFFLGNDLSHKSLSISIARLKNLPQESASKQLK
jgi:site-specific DNA-methyltransferase (adenine-specific)